MSIRIKITCIRNIHRRKRTFIFYSILNCLYFWWNKEVFISSMTLELHMRWVAYSTLVYLLLWLNLVSLIIRFIWRLSIKWYIDFLVNILIERLIRSDLRRRRKSRLVGWDTLEFNWRSVRKFWGFILCKLFLGIFVIYLFKLISFVLIFIRTDP